MTVRKEVYDGLRRKIYERDDYMCRYCGEKLHSENISLDHVVPVCLGGDNSPNNLVTCCCWCNTKKAGHPLDLTKMTVIDIEKAVVKNKNRKWVVVMGSEDHG